MSAVRVLVIGAGARGTAYGDALSQANSGAVIVAVAEPDINRRNRFGRRFIWAERGCRDGEAFSDWQSWLRTPTTVDAVFVCTLDETHAAIVTALAPLRLHVMCEKPLATSLHDCLAMVHALDSVVFSTGHVLRYSPHNRMLRRLLIDEEMIGEIISMEHTEPVGWWHFAHSYVRGKWRQGACRGPSLLTKCCHDLDFILWLMTSSPRTDIVHLPSLVSSFGNLSHFRRSKKPCAAGAATNCFHCDIEPDCKYSAKKIYLHDHYDKGTIGWPVNVVDPDIEDLEFVAKSSDHKEVSRPFQEDSARKRLEERLGEERDGYGKCVYEADNDVCDDQTVILKWDEMGDRGAKLATFHMTAHTERQCQRRGRVYGTRGEIAYDSETITVHDFSQRSTKTYVPCQDPQAGHGGGDKGLTQAFISAVHAVKTGRMTVQEAQAYYIGCSLRDIVRSHVLVFAAEEARHSKSVISWPDWEQMMSPWDIG